MQSFQIKNGMLCMSMYTNRFAVEDEIENYCIQLADRGFPMDWTVVSTVACQFAIYAEIHDFEASKGWLDNFKKRHGRLCTRVAQSLERVRAGGANKEQIDRYFEIVREGMHTI